ncbi:molybdate ABC transporter substrate-binding protein [Maribrevibacterium harenarium]|uniref:Molybdate ABC transporter substrate-binding protein n=1 Tax=Maribrevibacterium harenarium TaxID=2589817 RepID=A0A501WC53_9GAMM|nr:molybdate ABC transporter substrate-binding protein [Maribrevibacterium harenarium]TPE47513.1 molybdate ABC transporter substrate-binding protein [Maribrevibacterium harenarium]
MRTLKKLLTIALSYLFLSPAHGEEIHAAVAANFNAAMQEVVAQFEQNTGHKVVLSFGSSGKIFAQIQHGAPFQIFLSADQNKPEALEKAGFSVPGSRFTYAIGALALWSAKADFAHDDTRLKSGDFNKLALANPKLAPYGVAAVEVLESLKLRSATEAKWVMGENIAQTYQFVHSGNADLGLVALAQIMEKGKIKGGSSWIIPAELYSPIRQDAVLLNRAKDSAGAKALLSYLTSEDAREIIHSYGYTTE